MQKRIFGQILGIIVSGLLITHSIFTLRIYPVFGMLKTLKIHMSRKENEAVHNTTM